MYLNDLQVLDDWRIEVLPISDNTGNIIIMKTGEELQAASKLKFKSAYLLRCCTGHKFSNALPELGVGGLEFCRIHEGPQHEVQGHRLGHRDATAAAAGAAATQRMRHGRLPPLGNGSTPVVS